MQKWEYLTVIEASIIHHIVLEINGKDVKSNKWDFFSYINRLGEEGWELVGIGSGLHYIFKRPKV